jgi:hypothetical protein
LLSLDFRACVVKGESPLCNVKRPWRLNLQAAKPDSYAVWEILIRTESPIITFGGSLARKLPSLGAPEEEPERAWAKDFPISSKFAFVVAGASMEAINNHGQTMIQGELEQRRFVEEESTKVRTVSNEAEKRRILVELINHREKRRNIVKNGAEKVANATSEQRRWWLGHRRKTVTVVLFRERETWKIHFAS